MCVCVCALFMQHCGDPQGKTWKRDIFNIVGSPRPQKKKNKKIVNDVFIWTRKNANRFSARGIGIGLCLGGRKLCLFSIKVIEAKSLQITEINIVCVCVCRHNIE